MGFYESFAKMLKFGSDSGMNNLRRFYLILFGLASLPLLGGGFHNTIIKIANTPIPLFTSVRVGQIVFILLLTGLIGYWRRKL